MAGDEAILYPRRLAELEAHIDALLREAKLLRRNYLCRVQREAKCEITGKPCREPERCGCLLEMCDDLAEG